MAPERTSPSLLPAGIAPVDAAWGGLLRGGTYLLVGSAAARGRLALGALRGSAEADALGLLVSSRPASALLAAAAADGFDLAAAYRAQHAKLIGAPAPAALAGLDDAGLAHALDDLAGLLRRYRLDRLVIEDFSAFVRFSTFDAFATAFRTLAEAAAAASVTLALGLGEPANASSNRLLLFLQSETAGTLHTTASPEGDVPLALLPGTAHVGDARTVRWNPGAPPETRADGEDAAEPEAPARRASMTRLIDFEVDETLAADAETLSHRTAAPAEASFAEEPAEEDTFAEDPFAEDDFAEDGFSAEPIGQDDGTPAGSDGFSRAADLALDPPDLLVPTPPPLDDADWTAITPVDPAEAPFSTPAERDPFAVDLGPDLLALGHFVDSRTHGARPPSGDGLASAASSVHQAAYPELFLGASASGDAPGAEALAEDPEAAFRRALSYAFAARSHTPFLVLALRLDPAGSHADLLPAIAHGLDAALGDDGALFGSPEVGCLVALLPGAGSESASGLFAAVRAHLHAVAPDRAEEALRAVGALAVPSGEPFASADDLLAYVMA